MGDTREDQKGQIIIEIDSPLIHPDHSFPSVYPGLPSPPDPLLLHFLFRKEQASKRQPNRKVKQKKKKTKIDYDKLKALILRLDKASE